MTTLLAEPRAKGYIRAARQMRVDVPAHHWHDTAGTDYWLVAGSADPITASGATNLSGLDSYGWTNSGVVFGTAVLGDFISAADIAGGSYRALDANDVLTSPLIFGDYAHALLAGQHLGYVPTRLALTVFGQMSPSSNNETGTLFGLHNGSASVAAIYSDGTNFILTNGSQTDSGIAVDGNLHLWKIEIDKAASTTSWWIDDALQGNVDVAADAWPAGFRMAVQALGANDIAIHWARIHYE